MNLTAAALALLIATAAPTPAQPAVIGDGGWAGSGADPAGTTHASTMAAPPGYPVGIDVSSHDHSDGKTINWPAEAANGVSFAYIKSTEGLGYTNDFYNSDYNAAKAAGIFAGAYHWGRPDLGNPVGQADHMVDTMRFATDGRTLPPFLDIEWPYKLNGSYVAPYPCYGLSQSAMVSWISAFLNRVEARIGRTPAIYTNVNWWNPCTGSSSAFSRYPLDISSCNSSPPSVPGWGTNWTFWQYDIPGCGRGATRDWDVFNGSYTQLAAFAGATNRASPTSGDIGVVTAQSGVLAAFRIGSDARVWGSTQSGSLVSYGPWAALGTNTFTSHPASIVSATGLIVDYARAGDGKVYGISQLAPGGAYGSWGQVGTGQPSLVGDPAAQMARAGNLVVYARATDGRIWGVSQLAAGGAYGSWIQVGTASPTLASDPAALLSSAGLLASFARASDNTIWGVSQVGIGGMYGNWTRVGNGTQPSSIGKPGVTSTASGQIVVYTTAGDGSVWGVNQLAAGGAYGSWTRLPSGPAIASSPAALLASGNLLAVYARGADNNIYGVNQLTAGGAYGSWTTVGTGSHAAFTGNPSATVAPNGAIAVYAQGSDGWIWGSAQSAAGGAFSPWTHIGS